MSYLIGSLEFSPRLTSAQKNKDVQTEGDRSDQIRPLSRGPWLARGGGVKRMIVTVRKVLDSLIGKRVGDESPTGYAALGKPNHSSEA
jgi:hypothetical protein